MSPRSCNHGLHSMNVSKTTKSLNHFFFFLLFTVSFLFCFLGSQSLAPLSFMPHVFVTIKSPPRGLLIESFLWFAFCLQHPRYAPLYLIRAPGSEFPSQHSLNGGHILSVFDLLLLQEWLLFQSVFSTCCISCTIVSSLFLLKKLSNALS